MEENNNGEKIIKMKQRHKKLLDRLGLMTKVDKENLTDEMCKNSSRMFTINLLKADAEFIRDNAEDAIKIIEAKIDRKVRVSSDKKLSEQAIKQKIIIHPSVVQARERYAEAKWKCNVCWAAVSSIAQKGEQLSNLGYNYRKELEHGVKDRIKSTNEAISRMKNNKQRGSDDEKED